MIFCIEEREALLAVKGVGPTVIKRFEEIGIDTLAKLAEQSADDIANKVADLLGSSCWKNSPQSKSAMSAAIIRAKQGL